MFSKIIPSQIEITHYSTEFINSLSSLQKRILLVAALALCCLAALSVVRRLWNVTAQPILPHNQSASPILDNSSEETAQGVHQEETKNVREVAPAKVQAEIVEDKEVQPDEDLIPVLEKPLHPQPDASEQSSESAKTDKQEATKIEPDDVEMERAFLSEVEELLQKKVFLASDEPINSLTNRSIFQLLLPDAEAIFKEMDEIENATATVESDEDSPDGLVKLNNDYDFLFCAYQLFEKHRLAVEEICHELQAPALLQGALSSNGIVNDMMQLVEQHLESPSVIMDSSRSTVMKGWLAKVHRSIKDEYLDVSISEMMNDCRSLLVCNMAARPCSLSSFDQLSSDLEKRLVERKLSTPNDVLRALKGGGHVSCYVNGEEVQAETNTEVGRFKAYLRTYSELFGSAEMFWDLAKEIGFPLEDGRNREADYSKAYAKLMSLDEAQKTALSAKLTEQGYDLDPFDKVLKYFLLSQNVLGQQTLYYFNFNLLRARQEKFKLSKIEARRPKPSEISNIKNNEFIINVKGSQGEIKIIRYDGILESEVILKQEYTIAFDVKQDKIFAPSKDNVSMRIECPKCLVEESAEIRTLLFVLPLIAESLNYPPLTIIYK